MPHHCPECLTEFEGSVRFCPEHGARLIDGQAPSDPFVGQVLDERFRLIEPIGSGGMGNVYRARQLSVDRDVAVKLLRTAATLEHEARDRFMREAKVISDFTHPNIVRLIDFGWEDDDQIPYLVMELIEGTDLSELMYGNRLAPRLAVEIARQVCTGLIEAHAANVIHRDLKPGNILLVPVSDGSFQAKLVDFGIALPTDASMRLTSTGMICGTPHYIAPEQARGDDVGPAADLYSLGIILFEMVAGTLPFQADSEFELLVKHTDEQPPSLREFVGSDAPPSLIDLVDGLLSKTPRSRPDGALALRKQLDTVVDDFDSPPVELDPGAEPSFAFDPWLQSVDEASFDTVPERRRADPSNGELAHADTAFIDEEEPSASSSAAAVPTETHHFEENRRPTSPPETQQPQDADPLAPPDETGDDNRLVLVGVGLGTVAVALLVSLVMLNSEEEKRGSQAAPELPSADESPTASGATAPDSPDQRQPALAAPEHDTGDDETAGEADARMDTSADDQPTADPPAEAEQPSGDHPTKPDPQPAAPPSQPEQTEQADRSNNSASPNDKSEGDEQLDEKIEESQEWLTDDW